MSQKHAFSSRLHSDQMRICKDQQASLKSTPCVPKNDQIRNRKEQTSLARVNTLSCNDLRQNVNRRNMINTNWIAKTTIYSSPLSLFFFSFSLVIVIYPLCYPHILERNSKRNTDRPLNQMHCGTKMKVSRKKKN